MTTAPRWVRGWVVHTIHVDGWWFRFVIYKGNAIVRISECKGVDGIYTGKLTFYT